MRTSAGKTGAGGDSADGLESSEGALARESAGESWLSSGISAGTIGQSARTWLSIWSLCFFVAQ